MVKLYHYLQRTNFREFREFWLISQNEIYAKFCFRRNSGKKYTEKNMHKKRWLTELFYIINQ